MPEQEHASKNKLSKFVSSFSLIGLLLAVAFLSILVLGLASHIESLAPAEFRILIDILKNRFFR